MEKDFIIEIKVEVLSVRTFFQKAIEELVHEEESRLNFREYKVSTWVGRRHLTISLHKPLSTQILSLLLCFKLRLLVLDDLVSNPHEHCLQQDSVICVINRDRDRLELHFIAKHLLD